MVEKRRFSEAVTGGKRLARTALNNLGDHFFWHRSRHELRTLLETHGNGNSEGLFEIFDRYRGMGWYRRVGATQIRSEFLSLIDEVKARRPRVILEIGTARGGSLLAWCRVAEDLVISIDLPGGIHGGGYVSQRAKLYEEFVHAREGVGIKLLREDSHEERTRAMVSDLLRGRQVDFLFIDGDHTYGGVKKDFELWKPLVAKTGMLAFHDIVRHPEQPSINVHRWWEETRGAFRTRELVEDREGGFGIGCLYPS